MRRFFLAALLVSSPALAQDPPADDEEVPNVQYQKVTEIDFGVVGVNADIEKPQGVMLAERKRAAFNPLIRLRQDFTAEMAASVDEIK